jgi:hypothetical protein
MQRHVLILRVCFVNIYKRSKGSHVCAYALISDIWLVGCTSQQPDRFLLLRAFKPSSSESADRGRNIIQVNMWVDNDVLILENFYRSPFSKWPPQYRTNSTLSDFNAISYVGRLWCPELIPNIEKYLPVTIFQFVTKRKKKLLKVAPFHQVNSLH